MRVNPCLEVYVGYPDRFALVNQPIEPPCVRTVASSPTPRALSLAPWAWIPIRSLASRHKGRILAHLVNLDDHDRYLRFGYPATDEQISQYVNGLNFERDAVFGVFDHRLELVATVHLANAARDSSGTQGAVAEFGVSVLSHVRGRGYGARLFEHAVMHARNQGVDTLIVHALSENTAMLKIARRAGAKVHRDGPEADATLKLPPKNIATHFSELIEQQAAEMDYQLKAQACCVNEVLEALTLTKASSPDGLPFDSRQQSRTATRY